MTVLPGVCPGALRTSMPGRIVPSSHQVSSRSKIGGSNAEEFRPPINETARLSSKGSAPMKNSQSASWHRYVASPKRATFPVGGPTEVVEMEMGQDDVGDVRRPDSEGGRFLMNEPGPLRNGMRAYSGVDEDETLAAAHEETTHLNGQHSVVVQELGVLEPILIGLVEQSRRRHRQTPVGDTLDRHRPYLHAADHSAEGAQVTGSARWFSPLETSHRGSPRREFMARGRTGSGRGHLEAEGNQSRPVAESVSSAARGSRLEGVLSSFAERGPYARRKKAARCDPRGRGRRARISNGLWPAPLRRRSSPAAPEELGCPLDLARPSDDHCRRLQGVSAAPEVAAQCGRSRPLRRLQGCVSEPGPGRRR